MDLLDLRNEIDKIDEQLIPLLQHRMNLSKAVAEYKVTKRDFPYLTRKGNSRYWMDVKEK